MKAICSVLKTIILFMLLVVLIIALAALLGVVYVKVVNMISNQTVKFAVSVIWFAIIAGTVLHFGKKGIAYILNRE